MSRQVRFNKRFFVIIGVLVVLILIGFFFLNQGKQSSYSVQNFTLKEESTMGSCKYSTVYGGKTVDLGTYKAAGGCKTTQSVVANKMLAVAAGNRTFLYSPITEKIVVLDPASIKSYTQYAQKNNINLNDFSQRRYTMAGSSWQIIYMPNAKVKTQVPRIVFSTTNAGKTFTFNLLEQ